MIAALYCLSPSLSFPCKRGGGGHGEHDVHADQHEQVSADASRATQLHLVQHYLEPASLELRDRERLERVFCRARPLQPARQRGNLGQWHKAATDGEAERHESRAHGEGDILCQSN